MPWLLLLTAIAYSVVSTFGAWSVARRRRGLAFTFLASAALLMVGGVAAAYRLPESVWILAVGAALASLASLWNAQRVLHQVIIVRHLARAAAGAALVAVAAVVLW